MARIDPPEKKKPDAKAPVKKTRARKKVNATEQIPPDSVVPLQLKIPEPTKNEFKACASMKGQSMNALFLEMFAEYKENQE